MTTVIGNIDDDPDLKVPVQKYIFTIARIALGGLFVWAAWEKLMSPEAFVSVIENYRLLPSTLINPVALILPMLEAICGCLLIANQMTKGAVLILIALLIVFIGALGTGLIRGLDINCGCFSLSDSTRPSLLWALIQDLFLLLTGVWILLYKLNWIPWSRTEEN